MSVLADCRPFALLVVLALVSGPVAALQPIIDTPAIGVEPDAAELSRLRAAAIQPGLAALSDAAIGLADRAGLLSSSELVSTTATLVAASGVTDGAALAASLEAQAGMIAVADGLDRNANPHEIVMQLLRAQPRNTPTRPLPVEADFATLPEAILALYDANDRVPDAAAVRAIDAYSEVPEPLAGAVTRILAAFLLVDEATQLAFAAPGPLFPFDDGLMLAARDHLADVVLRERPNLTPPDVAPPPIAECYLYLISLGTEDNVYGGCDYIVTIEIGGDDTFATRAGGNLELGRSALHIDASGTDVYACQRDALGMNGGGALGSGHFFDFEGSETFTPDMAAGHGGLAGAVNGSALFIDLGGDDTHLPLLGSGAALGGAINGVAAFIDLAGNDSYAPVAYGTGAVNGASIGGEGLLVDLGGNDGRHATIGGDGAANGAAIGGSALLYDSDGNDIYIANVAGAFAANGAALGGVGTLVDAGGNEEFFGGPQGTWGASNGAAYGTALLDAGNITAPGGVGILIARGPGLDEFHGHNVTMGAGSHQGNGLLYTDATSSVLQAYGGSFAQGSGRYGGTGILIDRSVSSNLAVSNGVGQARGDQGVGVLYLDNETGDHIYGTYVTAPAFRAAGGGVAVWQDRGVAIFQGYLPGQIPDPTCGESVTLLGPNEDKKRGPTEVWVCSPDPDEHSPLQSPATGEPIGPLPKPAIPCSSITVASVNCGDEVDEAIGPGATAWLESDTVTTTTAGGVTSLRYHEAAGDPFNFFTTIRLHSADEACGAGCGMF